MCISLIVIRGGFPQGVNHAGSGAKGNPLYMLQTLSDWLKVMLWSKLINKPVTMGLYKQLVWDKLADREGERQRVICLQNRSVTSDQVNVTLVYLLEVVVTLWPLVTIIGHGDHYWWPLWPFGYRTPEGWSLVWVTIVEGDHGCPLVTMGMGEHWWPLLLRVTTVVYGKGCDHVTTVVYGKGRDHVTTVVYGKGCDHCSEW